MRRRRSVPVIWGAASARSARAGFSLHPLKNLGVYGDGGLITTNDEALQRRLIMLRNHGLRNRDECALWGYNSRLDPLQRRLRR